LSAAATKIRRERLGLRGGDRHGGLVVAQVGLECVLIVGELLLERDERAPPRVRQPRAAARQGRQP